MKEKFLFMIDVDGTLVPSGESKIDAFLAQKITDLKKLGHIFSISTGRAASRVFNIENYEVFDYAATILGNAIFEVKTKTLIHKGAPLSSDDVYGLSTFFEENGILWSFKTYNSQFSISNNAEFLKLSHSDHAARAFFEECAKENSIVQFLCEGHLSQKIKAQFPNLHFFDMPPNYSDICKRGAGKAQAVDFFRKKFPSHKIVAIGDSANDLPMLKAADISIAMGNTKDEVKKETNFVTKSVEENGVFFALENILKL